MGSLRDILTNPLFIIKQLQRDKIRKHSSFLKGKILDIGCGSKPYKKYAAYTGYVGIDASADLRPDARARSEDLPFKTSHFDAVICTEVLEHLKEPERCLSEIHRVLKTGGYAYITVPQSWGLHYEPDDYWRFTKYGMQYLAEKFKFEIIQIEKIGGFFSLSGQESVDFVWTRLVKILAFLGMNRAERIASVLCFPISLVYYFLGAAADRMDNRFAIGWAVICKK